MNSIMRAGIVLALVAAVAAVVILKKEKEKEPTSSQTNSEGTVASSPDSTSAKALPRLLDLGAGKCIPCKMMAPILEELEDEYKNQFLVEFIDVWKNPEESKKYGINLIPTQIFFDATGKERFRHEGFFSKEDILAKWKELEVDVTPPSKTADNEREPGEPR